MKLVILIAAALTAASCSAAPAAPSAYTPRTRDMTITAVPLLTKEMVSVYPFLKQSFDSAGVLAGKEVYAFVPSTVTVMEGDTIRFHLLNPEDDEHSFVVGNLAVAMKPQSSTDATYIATKAGIYTITCAIPAHLPTMWGQLVVLATGSSQSR